MNIGDKVVFRYDKISDSVGVVVKMSEDGVTVKWGHSDSTIEYRNGEVRVPKAGEIEQRKIATKIYEESRITTETA
jgi:exosome complex RNA-binding protein Csl4